VQFRRSKEIKPKANWDNFKQKILKTGKIYRKYEIQRISDKEKNISTNYYFLFIYK